MEEKLVKIGLLLSDCFIHELLENPNVTDISYNGSEIYYLDNQAGRCKFEIDITDDEIYAFLRQISNLCDVSFSLSQPILDVSFLNYRLNAVYKNVCRKRGEKVLTFCLRKFNLNKIMISEKSNFTTSLILKYLSFAVKMKLSILIGGPTSSGKTELQKYLINQLRRNERIVVIDTINELDIKYNDKVDITCLLTDAKQNIDLQDLVKLSLRYCPDYVVLAEARGAEFEDVLTSSLSGISTITTIHAKSVDTIVERAINLVQINNKNLDYHTIKDSILMHFDLLIYVKKVIEDSGVITRKLVSLKLIDNGKLIDLINKDTKDLDIDKLPEPMKEEFLKYNV
jgi:type IV secretory pathway ATPase VirB11/archaellum biosynthesis ATPase